MVISSTCAPLLAVFVLSICTGSAASQVVIPPVKIKPLPKLRKKKETEEPKPVVKRRLVLDKKGQWQWGKYGKVHCAACQQRGKQICSHCIGRKNGPKCLECKSAVWTTCHVCAGKKVLPDPLSVAPCPGCSGHRVLPCFFCNNLGKLKWEGVSKKSKCRVCKGSGGLPCTVCKGKRIVRSGLGGKIGTASVERLEHAKRHLEQFLAAARPKPKNPYGLSLPRSVAPRELKDFASAVQPCTRLFPEMKKLQALADALDKRYATQNAKDSGVVLASNNLIASSRFYALHQLAIVNISLKRAKDNAANKMRR